MANSDAAAWAQAYLSAAAILISGTLAILVPWNERRLAKRRADLERLDVECRRSPTGGFELFISYLPEFRSHTLGVGIELLEPKAARIYKGTVIAAGSDVARKSVRLAIGSFTDHGSYNAVPLVRGLDPRRPEAHIGAMYIEFTDGRGGPDHIRTARITIDVLRHGINRFYRHTLRVSPIDDAYFTQGRPIALITGDM